ncbi:caspase family protein [Chitinophaga caseinilytica]|uniref:caspase family protein n=1 Tax=Chitinophaga caseinilytica TaxID=2267521 RepID=UPI003C2E6485
MPDRRFAILIGICDYPNDPLDYPSKDVLDMRHIFVEHCSVEDNDIYKIVSERKSPNPSIWSSFINVIGSIRKEFSPGSDSIFFYFSGHGVPGESTTVDWLSEKVTIERIFSEINDLSPRNQVYFFDSCYSGAGMWDEKEKSQLAFHYNSITSHGYNILCACSKDQKAKESRHLQNGKFTKFLVDTVSNKGNYDANGLLTINRLFHLVDGFLKANTDFQQTPFQQIKNVGDYPLAFLGVENSNYFSRHTITSPMEHPWQELVSNIAAYCPHSSARFLRDLVRYVREHVRNASEKGEATFQQVEISNQRLLLMDNGKTLFDPFNPPEGIRFGGGLTTAMEIRNYYGSLFNVTLKRQGEYNYYEFELKKEFEEEPCSLTANGIFKVMEIITMGLKLDESCKEYTIKLEASALALSDVYKFFGRLVETSMKEKKKITVHIPQDDILKKHCIVAFESIGDPRAQVYLV